MSTATTTRTRGKRPAKAAPPLADEGIVVAVVAVTGTDDHVGDVIAPGAFLKTLKRRRPKLAFNHDWADPLGRVLHITELMPGDARLPKKLPDGRAWPRAAGAVIATMQFHMGTLRGREIFEHTKQWALAGEAAFSIGYKATPGRASKRADGVRVIYELELYEVSVVLHGAHDMALALEVKGLKPTPFIKNKPGVSNWVEDAGGLPPYIREVANALVRDHGFSQSRAIATAKNRMERWAAGEDNVKPDTIARAQATLLEWAAMRAKTKTEGKALGLATRDAPAGMATVVDQSDNVPDHSGSAMLALIPGEEVAAGLAVDGGLPAGDLHVTVAFLGDAANIDAASLVGQLAPALAGHGPLEGSVGGLGVFPPGEDGTPVWAPVDVPGLDSLRTAAVNALAAAGHPQQSEHGFTPHMTLGYDLPSVDPVPPTRVTFTHAALVVGGEHHLIPLTAAPMEGKSAAWAVRSARLTAPAYIERKTAAAAVLEAKSLPLTQETKSMRNRMEGSYEELREKLERAIDALFEKPKNTNGGDLSETVGSCSWIEATFPDRVVVTHTDYSKGAENREETYVVTYSVDEDGKVTLGEPEPAQINVTLAADEPDEDSAVLDADEAAQARFTLPLADMLNNASTLAMLAPEGKGLEADVRPALDALLDQLAAKGMPYSPDPDGDDDDQDWDALAAELDADADGPEGDDPDDDLTDEDDPDDDLPAPPMDLPAEDDDMVLLDPAEVDADMAELQDDDDL